MFGVIGFVIMLLVIVIDFIIYTYKLSGKLINWKCNWKCFIRDNKLICRESTYIVKSELVIDIPIES